ncbi:hypothetical protein X971_3738 [Agrobacterium tumefaciens LBA4213 (Ach5)]|nr:hypothetical protein X971_3738 [Agrobacterium tumefaciens LBA4213 (Ach5)]
MAERISSNTTSAAFLRLIGFASASQSDNPPILEPSGTLGLSTTQKQTLIY